MSKIASSSFLACQTETKFDYLVDMARCINSDHSECADEINAAFTNEAAECKAINQACIEVNSVLHT